MAGLVLIHGDAPARLRARLRNALIFGTLGWEVFADLYNRQWSVARGLGAGIAGATVTLLVFGALLALVHGIYGHFLRLSRLRPAERADAVAAFRALLGGVLAYEALFTLLPEIFAPLPPGPRTVIAAFQYELSLAGAAALSVGLPPWTRRGSIKACSIGLLMEGLLLLSQVLSGAGLHPHGAMLIAWVVAGPMAMAWAFNAGVWPTATRSLGFVAGTSVSVLLFAEWCVGPTPWSEAWHLAVCAAIGALGLWLTYRGRPGIR